MMMRTRKLGLSLLAAALGVTISAVLPLTAQNPRPVPEPDAIQRGEGLYNNQCSFCHGEDGRGGESGAADLIRSPLALDDEGGDLLAPFLADGRPNQGMPAFTFARNEAADVAAYVRKLQRDAILRNNYPILNVMTGDAEAGRAFFNGAGGCSGCHSPTGDLAGVASRFDPHILQVRMLYPNRGRGARPTIATIRPRSGGAAIRGEVEFQDDFSIRIQDQDGYHRGFSLANVDVELADPYRAHQDLLPKYTDKQMHDVLTYLGTLR